MLVLDVDGVLTDGRIIYGDDGVEVKAFHVRDGSGLKIWQARGKRVALITGRTSRIVNMRATELGINLVFQGASEKGAVYRHLLSTTSLRPEQVCSIGDDLPDLAMLSHSGLAVAVADACPEVRASAHYVTRTAGGGGAVREVIEVILGCQGHWSNIVEHFRQV
jgi:YrbI family 3-deoxy-D-manno-octulosonate 8-phosphate phosphatase